MISRFHSGMIIQYNLINRFIRINKQKDYLDSHEWKSRITTEGYMFHTKARIREIMEVRGCGESKGLLDTDVSMVRKNERLSQIQERRF